MFGLDFTKLAEVGEQIQVFLSVAAAQLNRIEKQNEEILRLLRKEPYGPFVGHPMLENASKDKPL